MSKRFTIISIILLLSGVALLGFFLHQGRKILLTDPYKIVSSDAGIIIETIDLRNLINSVTTRKGLFSEVGNVKEFASFNSSLKFVADQINKAGFKKILQEGTAVISFHPSEAGRLIPFLSKAIPSEIGPRQLKDALVSSGIKEINEKKVNGKRIFGLPFSSDGMKDTAYITISSGLLVCSSSLPLVKKAVLPNPHMTDIRDLPGFSKILQSSGKNQDKVFIVFANLEKTALKIFSNGAASLSDKIGKLGGSAGGDIFINDDGLSLSGYTESSDNTQSLYRYMSVTPAEFRTNTILPSETAMFRSAVFSYERVKKNNPEATSKISGLAERLYPYIGDEITKAFIDIKGNPVKENSVIIYKLKNRVQCENILIEFLGGSPAVSYFNPDDQTRIPVYISGITGLLSELMPEFDNGFNDSLFAFYDNYMITGSSIATISRILYDNLLNKTLANDNLYKDFEKMIPSRAGYLFYCVPSKCIDYFEDEFSAKVAEGLRSNKSVLNKIQSFGFQLASINGMLYNSLSVRYKSVITEESTTEWETLLDTTAAIKPFFFTNHNTGAKEIFVQDIKNNAYLINAAGRVLWKVPLQERITGTVYMIDYFRNGKYQLLFSGKNYLHLLDRNGNYVERYPVKLRSPATNSLALFDYENNNNYRIVIAGEDKLIYCYDKGGSVVKGWEPFRTAGLVSSEAGFYRVSGKDYIVVADEISIYFLDRNGKTRLRLKDAVTKAKGSALRLNPASEPELICSSSDGTVEMISFSGEVRKLTFRTFSVDHSFDFFDVDGDGFGEYIFIDKGILYLYDHNKNELFSKDFSSKRLGGPINFIFSATDREIGVFDIGKNLIYLIGSKGEIMKGFPLKGASMFSIGKLSPGNEWHLIVGGTDRFMYNYKLDTSQK